MKPNQKMKQMWGRIREMMPRTMEDIRANEMYPELYLKRRSERRKDIVMECVCIPILCGLGWATITLIRVCF